MKKISVALLFLAAISTGIAQTITDIDGNVYNTITIGSQVWMSRNLRVTHYNNGNKIPKVTDAGIWTTLSTGAYCWQNNDSVSNANLYGALYNGYTTNGGNLCPAGWHVPTDADWTSLTDFLGGLAVAGGKLKETGTENWSAPNTGATNDFGFTALPGGSFDGGDGIFHDFKKFGTWWSSTTTGPDWAYTRQLGFMETTVKRTTFIRKTGLSVRCIKDDITSVPFYSESEDLMIYPNPAYDKIYLENNVQLNHYLTIFDLYGKMVLYRKIDSNPVDISNLRTGIYVARIVGSNNVLTTKLIIK